MRRRKPSESQGQFTLWAIDEKTGERRPLSRALNTLMYKWGHIACRSMFLGDTAYKVSAVYIEYKNVASPGDTVSVPSFNRGSARTYYDGLSTPVDYLRVPLSTSPAISIQTGFETYFTSGVDGNKITVFAQTSGTVGVHGVTFSDSVNSKVYGLALVATPVPNDPTKDVLFCRAYYDGSPSFPQQLKLAGMQIGVTYSRPFE